MELTPLDLLAANVPCRGRYDSDVEQWIVMESKCALSSRRMHGTGVSARSGLGYDPGEVQKPISSRSSGRLSMYRARNQGTGNRQSASSCSGGLSGGKDGPMEPRTRLAWLSSCRCRGGVWYARSRRDPPNPVSPDHIKIWGGGPGNFARIAPKKRPIVVKFYTLVEFIEAHILII
jgi:hypothetical protein